MNHFVLTKASSLQVAGTQVELNQGLVTLQAEAGQFLRLMNIDPAANEAISLWRKGDDLQILANGELQVVVEDFYRTEGDGGLAIQDGPFIPQGAGDQVAGNGEGLVWLVGGKDDSGAAVWLASNAWLVGGAVGAAGAVYFLTGEDDEASDDVILQISPHAGPFESEVVANVYNGSGTLIGTGSINIETGQVNVNLGRYRGMVIIEIVDANGDEADYSSEVTGEGKDLDTNLRAMGEVTGRGTFRVSVTPLTELAARAAGLPDDLSELADNPLTSEQVAINEQIAALFGLEDLLEDVLTTLDDDYDSSDGTSSGELYGDVLAILSGVEENVGGLDQLIDQLLNEITFIDGVATLSAAGAHLLQQGLGVYEEQGSGAQLTGQTWIEKIPRMSDFPSVVTLNELNDDQSLTLDILSVSAGDEVVIALGDQSLNITITEAMLNDGSASVDFPTEQLFLLDDGTQTLSMSVNGEARQTTQLSLDLTRPSVSVSLDDSLLTIDANGVVESTKVTFTFSEAVTDFSIDDITLEQGSLTGLASQDGGLTWVGIYTPETNVEDASLLIRVSGDYTDLNGNAPDGSSDLNTETAIDTQVPEAPVLSLQNDSGTDNSDQISNQGTLSLSGVETGATVEYSLDGGTSWNTEFSAVEGENSVQARQIDAAGNTSAASESLTFTLDTSAAAPAVALSTDSGRSTSDQISNDGSLAVTATETGATLEYSIDGEESWSDSFTAVEGDNSVQVRQTDLAGNTSAASESLTFTLDTIAPATPVISLSSDTGSSSGDRITKTDSLTLTGIEANAIVEYSIDGGTTWSTEFDAVEGVNSVQVRQTDVAGNISAASNTLTFTLDTTVPTVPTLTLTTDSGSSTSDKLTNDGTLTTTGLETGATVQYSTDNGSTWSSSFTAVEGENSVQVRQTDVAGNTSASRAITFTLDTEQPEALTVALLNDTGDSTADLLTNDGTLNVTGIETGATLQYSNDGTSWTSSFNSVEGTNTVWIRQIDAAGNESDASSLTFTLDTEVPVAPTLALLNDTGYSTADLLTNDGTLDVTGVETGATLQYSTDGTSWSSSFSAVEGTNTVWVRQVDAAGNESDASDALTFTLDTEKPEALTVALLKDTGDSTSDLLTNDGTLNVTGVEDGATLQYSIDGATWSDSFTPVEGTNTVWVRQVDAAGNESDASNTLTFDLDTERPATLLWDLLNITGPSGDDIHTSDASAEIYYIEDGATVEYSVDNGNTWNQSYNVVEGENSFQVRQTDAAGNSSYVFVVSFTLDTEVPVAPTLALLKDTGDSTSDLLTNDGTLDVTGVEDGATLQYSIDGTTWADSFTSVEGTNTVRVRQVDAAGNESNASNTLTFDLDTERPATLLWDLLNITGPSGDDIHTSDASAEIYYIEDGATVEYSVDNGNTWNQSYNVVEGENSFQVRQTDAAGNSSYVFVVSFTLDTEVPVAPTLALLKDTGYSAADLLTNDGTLNVTGVEDGATLQYSIDGTTWADSFTPVEGINTVQVRQTDGAGNVSAASESLSFTLLTHTDVYLTELEQQKSIKLEPDGVSTGSDIAPQITALDSSGNYVVTWVGEDVSGTERIYVQLFGAGGEAIAELQVLEPDATRISEYYAAAPHVLSVGSSGEYLVVWHSADSVSGSNINIQAFNADGSLKRAVTQVEGVNTSGAVNQYPVVAAVGTEGAYVLAWFGPTSGSGYKNIWVQPMNADGSTNGPVTELGNTSGFFESNRYPTITATGTEGDYAVVWTGTDPDGGDSIYVQAFSADNRTKGTTVLLEAVGVGNDHDYRPTIASVGSAGNYVVAWDGHSSSPAGPTNLYVQLFGSDGKPLGATQVLDGSGFDYMGDVVSLGNDGSYVVVWSGSSLYSVFVQRFDSEGNLVGSQTRLDGYISYDRTPQVTTIGDDGAFVVVWFGHDEQGDYSIYVQRFSADGSKNGAIQQLEASDYLLGNDTNPQVSALGEEGRFVVTWSGIDSNGDSSVFVQEFDEEGNRVQHNESADSVSVTAGSPVYVTASESGRVYLVNSDIDVTGEDSITSADETLWNQQTIYSHQAGFSIGINTTGLEAGTYTAYFMDYAGNLNQVTEEINIEPLVDVEIDLSGGSSSMDMDGDYEFDEGVTYNIYLLIDREDGITDSMNHLWSGTSNLGADDTITLVAEGLDESGITEENFESAIDEDSFGWYNVNYQDSYAFSGSTASLSTEAGTTQASVTWLDEDLSFNSSDDLPVLSLSLQTLENLVLYWPEG